MVKASEESKKKSKDKINYNDSVKNGKPWWFQVMVNGERVTKRGFRTFTEAKKAREALSTELDKGTYIEPAKLSYGKYFRDWLDNRPIKEIHGNGIAGSTKDLYDSYFTNHIEPILGKIALSKLTPLDIKKFIAELRKKELGDQAVKRIYSTVSASLNSAVTMEIIQSNPASKIPKDEKPKVERKERQIWSNESVKYVLSNGKGTTRHWIAFFIAIMTGMRQGEVLGLKWSDVDFERSLIRVRRSLRKDKVTFKGVKNESSIRIISLSPLTIAFLEEHRDFVESEKKKLGERYEDNDLVVCSSKGTPARASKVLAAWYTMCDKFKPEHEPRITYHDLRHQSASIMLNEREDVRIVSQRLGHSTVSTTLNVYSHLLPTAQESAALALDRTIGFTTRG
ncbi:tyrosine-type recombinase/integrase [Paenibacillus sp. TAF43_2]|uniref:tyrosine-type recombinase/integrase n=1 Tax=Paenibacillus sp. TAF43_2 TaxID=3233069 RepID=UPI003F96D2A1